MSTREVKTRWTDDQLAAIETSGCNLLVAAAAGSGKTAVLVERIIRKITKEEDPVDIDNLLVVTFTNAAASEMRERVGDAISRELDRFPDSKVLQRQLTLLPKSNITTIHSFCLDVIRNNFHRIEIDPNFRIADDTETILLKQEAMEELFDENYEREDNEDFLELVECYGGNKDDKNLEEIVLNIYGFSESSAWPREWIIAAAEDFNVTEDFDFEKSKWADYLLKNIRIELTGLIASMERAIKIININPELEVYLPNFERETDAIEKLLEAAEVSWDSLYEGAQAVTFERLKPCKNADESTKKYVTDIRKKVKESIDKISENAVSLSKERIETEMKNLYPAMKALSRLVLEFGEKYSAKKRERGVIDFSDIEHYALDILTDIDGEGKVKPSEVALSYRERYEEVLVDEYQDSNLVQEVLLTTVSRSSEDIPNLFMVGDVKQSIYRFRQAMPELFLGKYNTYHEKEGRDRKITLFKNFRSRLEVIEGVNYIFKQIMSRNVGELDYSDREKLYLGAEYEALEEPGVIAGPVEIHIIESKPQVKEDTSEDEDDGEDEEDVDNIQLEARVVAKRIKCMISSEGDSEYKIYDKSLKTYRRVEYRDITVLLRTTKNWSTVFLDEFSREGIPAFADTGTGYFDTIEIKTMMALLQIIDNPMQDIPLLAVLRSPIFSFTPEELIDIRLEDSEGSLYEALVKTSEREQEATALKAQDFLNNLKKWKERSVHSAIDEFLWFIYMETGYFGYVSAMPGGVQRQANLKVLFERAKQFEETSYRGLFNFINFINRLRNSNGDMGSARLLGENENVVRIMSIHKSKGLEFPVVIVAGTGKEFNMMDLRKSILLHKELGYGPDFVNYKKRYAYSSTMKEAIKTRIRLETLSEEMRVLYVAFTRAKEKLIITGSVKNLEASAMKWVSSSERVHGKLSEYEITRAKNFLDWICPAVINHVDGYKLRELGQMTVDGMDDDISSWEINFWKREDVLKDKKEKDEELEEITGLEDIDPKEMYSPYAEEVERRLGFEYPFEKAYRLPAKLSVSELKHERNIERTDLEAVSLFESSELKRPRFIEKKEGLSAAERGTVTHVVMQHINIDRVKDTEQIKDQIQAMVRDEILTEMEAEAVNIKRIHRFFTSSLGQRMLASGYIRREVPFSLELPCSEVYDDLPRDRYSDEYIMLQGVIDCFFEEDGEIVLLDYKTDYVEDGKTDEIKERYRVQIDYYERALEWITGKKVKGKYIYLFYNGEVVEY